MIACQFSKIFYKGFQFLFVIIFIVLTSLIGIYLDVSQTQSVRERRLLEKKPDCTFLCAKEIEKYIADHIPFRSKIIDFYFETGLGIDLGTQRKIVGKNNFIFQASGDVRNIHPIRLYRNDVMFDMAEIFLFQKNVGQIAAFAAQNNIKVYFMVPPENMRIYHRFAPDYILRKNNPSATEQVEKALEDIVTVVPLEKKLIEKSKTVKYPLVYKTDTHWSEDAGFEAYKILLQTMQKDFDDIKILKRSDFKISYTDKVWNLYQGKPYLSEGSSYLPGLDYGKVRYRHYEMKNPDEVTEIWKKEFVSSEYPKGSNHRVYLIGDSFSYYFLLFLKATFKSVHFHRYNGRNDKWGIKWQKRMQEMIEDKTDILILSPSDQKLQEFSRFFE